MHPQPSRACRVPVVRSWPLAVALAAGAAAAQQQPAPAPGPTPPNYEVAEDGTVTVRGRVVFTDLEWKEHERANGRASAILWYLSATGGEVGSPAEIAIVEGAFTAVFGKAPGDSKGAPTKVTLYDVEIDGVKVLVETDGVAVSPGALSRYSTFLFRLRALRPLQLRVLDAVTKRELDGVEVLRESGWRFHGGQLHPGLPHARDGFGGELVRIAAGKSPLEVAPAEQLGFARAEDKLWVHAPGRTWAMLSVLVGEGGTREVLLATAGALDVRVTGTLPSDAKLTVRLYRADQHAAEDPSPAAEFALERRELPTIEGLPAGSYHVRLELGEWFHEPRVLAKAAVAVTVGATAAVELKPNTEIVAPPKVTVCGMLRVPPEWFADADEPHEVILMLRPLGDTRMWAEGFPQWELTRGKRPGEYPFVLPDVFTGRYAVCMHPSGCQRIVEVTAEAKQELQLEVPPPANVVLRVVDGNTKAPRNGVQVSWHPCSPPDVRSWSPEPAGAAPDSNEIRFRAPVGRITVYGGGDDYALGAEQLEVRPGDNEFELATAPLFGVRVVLYEGTTRIPMGFDSGFVLQLDPPQRPGTGWQYRGSDTPVVTQPGRYVLRVTVPEGYLPIADRQVVVTAPPFPTIELKVTRKP